MSHNYQKFRSILSKWPVKFPKEEYDYGNRLRELLKSKSELEEIFSGSQEENSKKLDALMRLVNNYAKNQYQINAIYGACGFSKDKMRNLIEQQFKMQEKIS